MHKDFESFLSEVNKAFDFLCKVYEVFSPDKNTDDENIDPRDLIRSQNVVIMDSEFRPKQSSTIIYDELLFSKDNSLDSKFFKKIFSDPKIKTRINIKHDLSKGYGFYNLCIDLMSYLMLTWSKPLLMNTLDHLVFENECDETDLQSVQKNFLVNFSSSIIYVTSFNIFVFHQSLGELVEKYQEGERLTNINLKRDIDLSKILTVGDLYDLLQVFETYGGGNKIYEVRDAYNFTGQHVRILIEQLAYIEEYSYYIVKSNINHFYLQCLLCIGFYSSEFEDERAKDKGSYIEIDFNASKQKINIDRYLTEIVNHCLGSVHNLKEKSKAQEWSLFQLRNMLDIIVPEENHVLLELYDEKLYSAIRKELTDYQKKFEELQKAKAKSEKFKELYNSCLNLSILALHTKCTKKNRTFQKEFFNTSQKFQKDILNLST